MLDDQTLAVLPALESICETEPNIEFRGKTFCFTGNTVTGRRSALSKAARALGATVKKSVSKDLDYLVIGTLKSPLWRYSTYGRKIERTMANKKQGGRTQIIHEAAFSEAVKRETEGE